MGFDPTKLHVEPNLLHLPISSTTSTRSRVLPLRHLVARSIGSKAAVESDSTTISASGANLNACRMPATSLSQTVASEPTAILPAPLPLVYHLPTTLPTRSLLLFL